MIATSFENVPVSPLAEPDTDTNELELAPAEEIAVETFEQESNVSSKKPSNSYVKPIVAIAAGCIIVAGVVLMILAFTLDPDDFESKMLEFEGDIQLEESDAGFIEWKDSYNDLKSPDSRNLIKDLSKKIKGALGEESFSVKDVEIYALMPTGARSFSRNEESDDMTDPHYGGKNAKFSKKEYKGIMNVDAKFKVFGKPSENAASFMSAKPESWWKLKKRLRSRLSNAGILSTVKDLKRNKRFEHAIKRGLRRKYVATTVPPVKREAEPCTCDTVLTRELSLENPSKVCYCESSCITGKNTVYGGLNDIFAIFTPVCASAFYAGVIPEEGGVVEALFTGRQEVKPGNQTIPEFTSESVPFVPRTITLQALGSLIIPTEPPPPPNYEGSGFSPMPPSTNPFLKTTMPASTSKAAAGFAVQFDEGDEEEGIKSPTLKKAYGNPPIVLHLHIKDIDKRVMKYSQIIFSARRFHILEDFGRKLNPMVRNKLVMIGFQGITIDFVQFHKVGDEIGFAGGFAIKGNLRALAQTIRQLEATEAKGGSPWKAMESIGKVINKRYSKDLTETLEGEDS